jgi:hypothetical protein
MATGSGWRSKLTELTTMLVLGAGLLALFVPSLSPIPFWVIWVVGFAVLVPMVEILLDTGDEDDDGWTDRSTERPSPEREAEPDPEVPEDADEETRDAIETLRERYARGDLTDKQFDRKLDRLLRTDTPENAAEWRERASGSGDTDAEREVE